MEKPSKPTPDFPLFAHNNGQWAKKVKGNLRYFGPWYDPEGAMENYLATTPQVSGGYQQKVSNQDTVSKGKRKVKSRQGKAKKPHPDFPLFQHASGRWAKKVRGQFRYFGKVADDPKGAAALEKWLEQRDDLLAGREPRPKGDSLTVGELCDRLLTTKKHRMEAGQIARGTVDDYRDVTDRIVAVFGANRLVEDLWPTDFGRLRKKIAERGGLVHLDNQINRSRIVFKYAEDSGLIEKRIVFGEEFRRPGRIVLRRHRQQKEQTHGKRMYEAAEIRLMLDAASTSLKAMILLAVNCGFGNADCGSLPMSALDLDGGWSDFPRPITGVERRCALWPETVEAIRRSLENRPEPKGNRVARLVFVTKYGGAWHTDSVGSPVSAEFAKLVKKIDKDAKEHAAKNDDEAPAKVYRKGIGFYGLRHTFETIGGGSRDQVAVNHIMGHADNSMAAVYRERISDERLRAVADHVREWLFGTKSRPESAGGHEITP